MGFGWDEYQTPDLESTEGGGKVGVGDRGLPPFATSRYDTAMTDAQCPYVTRGGLKLAAGLDGFGIDPAGMVCADLGCNVGGFTDCLLQRGARRVYAIDTGYGVLAWKLRKDDRVVVSERTNALHAEPAELVDLAVIDVAWTPQRLILPAAGKWLKPGGQVISLLKPHYEATATQPRRQRGGKHHVLDAETARNQCLSTCNQLVELGWRIKAVMLSPVIGGKGNTEFIFWAEAVE